MTRQDAIDQLDANTYGYKYAWMLIDCKESQIEERLEEAIKSALIYEDCRYDAN